MTVEAISSPNSISIQFELAKIATYIFFIFISLIIVKLLRSRKLKIFNDFSLRLDYSSLYQLHWNI